MLSIEVLSGFNEDVDLEDSDENEENPREFSVTKADKHNDRALLRNDINIFMNQTRNNLRKVYDGVNSKPMTSVDYNDIENQENIDANRQITSRQVKFNQKIQSVEPKRDFVKFDIKDCLVNMIKGTKELSQGISKSGSRSKSRSKSIPRSGHTPKPEIVPITITNQKLKNKPILKPSNSVRSIHSVVQKQVSAPLGAGCIASNRNSSVGSQKGSTIRARSNSEKREPDINSKNEHQTVDKEQYQSRFNTQRKAAGSIFRGNSARKSQNQSLHSHNLINSVHHSTENIHSLAHESPVVMITKELRFETEENTQNYEMDDLNALLQLNDDTHNYENLPLKAPENLSILNRHPVVQSELIHNHQIDIFKDLNSLDEPISVNNMSIYEPFYNHIFS